MSKPETIKIDEIEYVRKDSVRPVTGTRKIMVLDRGWIFVGNVTTENGKTTIGRCKNIRYWKSGGFGGLTKSSAAAVLDDCADIIIDEGSEILAVPVGEDW